MGLLEGGGRVAERGRLPRIQQTHFCTSAEDTGSTMPEPIPGLPLPRYSGLLMSTFKVSLFDWKL